MSIVHTLIRKIIPKNNHKTDKPENPGNNGTPEVSGRRDAIIDALNKSLDIFSSNNEKTFEDVMTNGIWPLADVVGLDRVVFYKVMDFVEEKRFGQIYRWDKAEGGVMSLAGIEGFTQ